METATLLLDVDYQLGRFDFSDPPSQPTRFIIIPEVVSDDDNPMLRITIDLLPSWVSIDKNRVLNPVGGRWAVYDPPYALLMAIAALTQQDELGLVIIGDNTGAGVTKAKHIAESLLPYTVVVAADEPVSMKAYQALGITQFFRRRDLRLQELTSRPRVLS